MSCWAGGWLVFVHLMPLLNTVPLSIWILTLSIGLGPMIGLILMVPLLNLFPCSTSTLLGRCANLMCARFVTTLTTISSSVPFHMSRLGVSPWSARFLTGWLPIE